MEILTNEHPPIPPKFKRHREKKQVSGDTKNIACNIGAGGYMEQHFSIQTHLTEPQGKIKIGFW